MQKSLINMKRRLQYASTQKRPTAPKKDLTAELHESENARLQLEEELLKLKQQSVFREARSKNCVVIYSFTVIVLHRAMLENHFAL